MGDNTSTFAPLRHAGLARILAGALAANLGNAIAMVGASWHLTQAGQPADVVALVQTMYCMPIMLLALPAGAFADMFDRRRIILCAMATMLALGLGLCALTASGMAGAVVILGMTGLLACGVACFTPALSGSIATCVPRAELAAAVALNITAFNTARAAGPALGGMVVQIGGAGAAYGVNAGCYVLALVAFLGWRQPQTPPFVRRAIAGVMGEGLRFALGSRELRRIMSRGLIFCTCGAAMWALMPLVASKMLGQGAGVFGLLLGALGLGAMLGASCATWVRQRLGAETIIRLAGVIFGTCLLIIATAPGMALTLVALLAAGAGWVQGMSGLAVAAQMWAPRELVGRITAMASSLTFGGIAISSWQWGHLAENIGVAQALAVSGAAMLALTLVGLAWPLPEHGGRAD